jgi:propionate CoA-transferase
MGKLVSPAEAAARIADGSVVTVSSSSALGCPDTMLAAIGARFEAEGHPRNLTTLHPIAAGDMYGVKGIDHIAQGRVSLRRSSQAPIPPDPHPCRCPKSGAWSPRIASRPTTCRRASSMTCIATWLRGDPAS